MEVLAIYRHIYFKNLYKISLWEFVTSSLIQRVEFLIAMTVKIVIVFWDVTPCSLSDVC
jgi:hypothetical protein